MEFIKKIEKMVTGWVKPLPHLPTAGQKWIAVNIWWLELIGVVVLCISGITMISLLLPLLGFTSAVLGVAGIGGFMAFSTILSLAFMIGSIAFLALAISPLKAMKKKGWDFLFIALLINVASTVLSAVFSFNAISFISTLFSGAIGIAVSTYLLFEIRSYFVSTK